MRGSQPVLSDFLPIIYGIFVETPPFFPHARLPLLSGTLRLRFSLIPGLPRVSRMRKKRVIPHYAIVTYLLILGSTYRLCALFVV